MPGHVQRAGTHAALVAAAVDDGGKLNARIAATDIQSANTLRSVDLVRGNGEKVDIVLLHIHGNLADCLHAVDGEDDAALLGDFADFRNRVDDADFIVGVHDTDQNCGGPDGLANIFRVDTPILLHREDR